MFWLFFFFLNLPAVLVAADWRDCSDEQRKQPPGCRPASPRPLQEPAYKRQGSDVVPQNCWGQLLKPVVWWISKYFPPGHGDQSCRDRWKRFLRRGQAACWGARCPAPRGVAPRGQQEGTGTPGSGCATEAGAVLPKSHEERGASFPISADS